MRALRHHRFRATKSGIGRRMGERAIVTGADSGIGKATAVRLGHDGFDVGLTYNTDADGAEGTANELRELGRRAVVRQLDVTRFEEAGGTITDLAAELGGLEVFVNNAGTGHNHAFLELSLEVWKDVLDVDLTGAFVCAQAAARSMLDSGAAGRIVNITSVHEHIPKRAAAAYCAAKGGLGLLTKVMALELAEHGITVNAVAPGEIATPMTGAHDTDPSGEERPALPLGRPGDAHEVAEAIAFLARPGARYATGSSLVVDGGLMLTAAEFNAAATPS
jgi:NAD(P)-dependent dehydrogenase (short-subunit alcohol dehydrogenase family)